MRYPGMTRPATMTIAMDSYATVTCKLCNIVRQSIRLTLHDRRYTYHWANVQTD